MSLKYAISYQRHGRDVAEDRNLSLAQALARLSVATKFMPEDGLRAVVFRHSGGQSDDHYVVEMRAHRDAATRQASWKLVAPMQHGIRR